MSDTSRILSEDSWKQACSLKQRLARALRTKKTQLKRAIQESDADSYESLLVEMDQIVSSCDRLTSLITDYEGSVRYVNNPVAFIDDEI